MTGGAEGPVLEVTDASMVGEVRRRAVAAARDLGWPEEAQGRAGLVATELAGNVWKHAGGGWCHVAARRRNDALVVRIVAVDRGPGIGDVAKALQDGYSTAGTPGTGLGAARRLSAVLDVFTLAGGGTVVTAEVDGSRRGGAAAGCLLCDGIAQAKAGQDRCGDVWVASVDGHLLWVTLADGLGHGVHAAEAAELAVATALLPGPAGPAARVTAIHERLRSTRGAAVALVAIDPAAARLRFSGIGNVVAVVEHAAERDGDESPGRARQTLVSLNGTAGHYARTVREFDGAWRGDSVLVLHSDGVTARWDLTASPGLAQRHPATIAAVLLRDFSRGSDDAAVVVARHG